MSKLKNKRIMVVDDNDIDILVNTKLLKIANISNDVVSFNGCQEIVEYFDANLKELTEISFVILMDIQMPDHDGFECVEILTEKFDTSNCQIYMLSSSIDRGDIKRAEENPNILKVLEKPLDVYQLKGLLEGE